MQLFLLLFLIMAKVESQAGTGLTQVFNEENNPQSHIRALGIHFGSTGVQIWQWWPYRIWRWRAWGRTGLFAMGPKTRKISQKGWTKDTLNFFRMEEKIQYGLRFSFLYWYWDIYVLYIVQVSLCFSKRYLSLDSWSSGQKTILRIFQVRKDADRCFPKK